MGALPRPSRATSRSVLRGLALAAASGLLVTGCAKSETDAASSGGGASAATSGSADSGQQVVESPSASGPGCTAEKYGVKTGDLKGMKVGFSQSEKEANPFRIAETQSMKDEAAKLGLTLETTNANSQLNKQISDIQDLLAKGVQVLVVAPLNSDGLEPAFKAAAAKGVPVITIDRKVNSTWCKDYVTFIGSNFVQQGMRAADELIKVTGGKGNVAILLGSAGNNVTTDRTKGFVDQLTAKAPGMKIVAKQTGEFARDKGQQVMEQLIQANPSITAVYAENDEMGIGAVTALKAAGKKPGKDVRIVSIDGTKNAVKLIVAGQYDAVIESNPRFGPLALETAKKFLAGDPIPQNVIISDKQYDKSNAAAEVDSAY